VNQQITSDYLISLWNEAYFTTLLISVHSQTVTREPHAALGTVNIVKGKWIELNKKFWEEIIAYFPFITYCVYDTTRTT
jgi:hypothetical protein